MSDEAYPDALPVGHRLHWYVLEHVLGQGGFGITYLARDTNLDRRVAIKEYLPTDYARRHADATVQARTESNAERYTWGLERFSLEARTLARFDHPSIVRVHSVFEANNTAYMVMRFEDGENLAHLLDRCVTLPERQLLPCLIAILDGLQLVHDAGFIHRDIKPENIYVREDGTPVLLDFGSARQSLGRSKTMTILVAPGYAPLEQYYGDSATQGPWTDIYGLGATCYRAIAGRAPLDAIARAKGVLGSAREMLQPAVEVGRGRYDERLLAAIDRALRLSERDRPQSIAEWRNEIAGAPTPAAGQADIGTPTPVAHPPRAPGLPPATAVSPIDGATANDRPPESSSRRPPWLWAGAATAIGLGAVATGLMLWPRPGPAPEAPSPQTLVRNTPPAAPPAASAPTAGPPEPAPPAEPMSHVDKPVENPTREATVAVPQLAKVVLPPPTRLASTENRTPAPRPSVTPAATASTERAPPPRTSPSTPPDPATAPVPPQPAQAESNPPGNQVAALTPAPTVPAAAASASMPSPPREPPAGRVRDEQLAAAEEAWRRGDPAAADLLKPLAAAGVPRAQALMGRLHETRAGREPNYFEAYVWYGIAARRGEPGAAASRDKVAGKLQPAEIQQAEKLVERWKPPVDANGGAP